MSPVRDIETMCEGGARGATCTNGTNDQGREGRHGVTSLISVVPRCCRAGVHLTPGSGDDHIWGIVPIMKDNIYKRTTLFGIVNGQKLSDRLGR